MDMDFIDQLKQFSKRVESMKDSIQTEENCNYYAVLLHARL